VNVEIQDVDYDYKRARNGEAIGRVLFRRGAGWRERQIARICPVCLRKGCRLLSRVLSWIELLLGCPVDQTLGAALAQIQIIAQKCE
jgi:hypothetical protein